MSIDAIQHIALFFPLFLLSLCFHEWAHAFTASRLGDSTPKAQGRLTMNPLAHADILGTFILPIIMVMSGSNLFFGWAKPVPINERGFKKPIRDMAVVAAAGPMANVLLAVILAIVSGLSYRYLSQSIELGGAQINYFTLIPQMAQMGIGINLFLAAFNLIPLGPLDGTKVLQLFIPLKHERKYHEFQSYGGMILMGLMLVGLVIPFLNPFAIIGYYVMRMRDVLINSFSF